jgi:proteic killer suppression protein
MPAGALTGVNREFTYGPMIVSFRHKGLKRFHDVDERRGLNPEQVDRIRLILTALAAAATIGDLDIPGFRCHPLSGRLKGRWAITVRANWRIVFRFEDGDAYDVDLVDYH